MNIIATYFRNPSRHHKRIRKKKSKTREITKITKNYQRKKRNFMNLKIETSHIQKLRAGHFSMEQSSDENKKMFMILSVSIFDGRSNLCSVHDNFFFFPFFFSILIFRRYPCCYQIKILLKFFGTRNFKKEKSKFWPLKSS